MVRVADENEQAAHDDEGHPRRRLAPDEPPDKQSVREHGIGRAAGGDRGENDQETGADPCRPRD
jgi:hypothetical protein